MYIKDTTKKYVTIVRQLLPKAVLERNFKTGRSYQYRPNKAIRLANMASLLFAVVGYFRRIFSFFSIWMTLPFWITRVTVPKQISRKAARILPSSSQDQSPVNAVSFELNAFSLSVD